MQKKVQDSPLEGHSRIRLTDDKRFQSFIDSNDNLMWSVDKNFNLLVSNLVFDKTLGRILFHTKTSDKIDLANQLRFITHYERALSGETFTELEHFKKPTEKWLEVSYYPTHMRDEITSVSCFGRDVTKFRKEFNHLKLLESIVTNASDAILITDAGVPGKPSPTMIFVNDALLKMTGYKEEEIIGRSLDFFLGPNTDRTQLESIKACFESSKPCEIEVVHYKKNGDEFWVHMAMAPVVIEDGHSTHLIAIGRDVTERLKNIASIKKQNLMLSEIAHVQSHEVRGPLARIKGIINLLADYSDCVDGEGRQELLRYLKISATEMDGVIKKIIVNTNEIPMPE